MAGGFRNIGELPYDCIGCAWMLLHPLEVGRRLRNPTVPHNQRRRCAGFGCGVPGADFIGVVIRCGKLEVLLGRFPAAVMRQAVDCDAMVLQQANAAAGDCRGRKEGPGDKSTSIRIDINLHVAFTSHGAGVAEPVMHLQQAPVQLSFPDGTGPICRIILHAFADPFTFKRLNPDYSALPARDGPRCGLIDFTRSS